MAQLVVVKKSVIAEGHEQQQQPFQQLWYSSRYVAFAAYCVVVTTDNYCRNNVKKTNSTEWTGFNFSTNETHWNFRDKSFNQSVAQLPRHLSQTK